MFHSDNQSFTSPNECNKKSKNQGIYTCPSCNALFTCLQYFQQHVKQHAEVNGMKLFCCRHCSYSTDQEFNYNWHIMTHTGQLPHSCNVCNKRDDSESSNHSSSNYVKIEMESDDDAPSSCSMVGKRSVATATTDDLLLIGSNLPTSSCIMTSKDQNRSVQESINRSKGTHQRYSQASDVDEDEDEDDDEGEEEQMIEEDGDNSQNGTTLMTTLVPACGQTEDDISDEEDDEEEEVESEEEDGETGYMTTTQGNEFYSEIIQGPPYTKSNDATESDMFTPTSSRGRGKGNRKSRSIYSMDTDGSGEMRRKFHCSHCGKSFKTKSHLQRHILTHTGEKPYHCNRCGSKFNQSSSLRNHIIAIHTKEYPHYCPQCGKGFLMPALLQKHLTTSHRNK